MKLKSLLPWIFLFKITQEKSQIRANNVIINYSLVIFWCNMSEKDLTNRPIRPIRPIRTTRQTRPTKPNRPNRPTRPTSCTRLEMWIWMYSFWSTKLHLHFHFHNAKIKVRFWDYWIRSVLLRPLGIMEFWSETSN